jgi:S1-C subfamily serine protease
MMREAVVQNLLPEHTALLTRWRVAIAILIGLSFSVVYQRPLRADPPADRIADVVAQVQASVVRVISLQSGPPDHNDNGATNASKPTAKFASGSGFIVDSDGFIATSRHVVESAAAVFLLTASGARRRADLVIMTPKQDIALVHIKAGRALSAVRLGDSDKMRVGDPVIAIGDPFGFDGSVSAGVISATNRDVMDRRW